jgi:anaerobic selenocysteine-containing dehydrogenase
LGLPTERIPIGAEDYALFYEIWGRKSPYGQVVCFPDSVPNVIKALIVTGGNPAVSMPDSNAFREAMKKLELLVVLDFFMTETAELAHYVLPGCTHLEKNGLAYSYNVCHGVPYLMLRKKAIEPLYESRSEFTFWKGLAEKMGLGEVFPWERDEEVVELELKSTGLSYKELKEDKIAGAYYMAKKYGMVIDVTRCNGCYNCQIACKDEHVGNDWSPYSKPQPIVQQTIVQQPSEFVNVVYQEYIKYIYEEGTELLDTKQLIYNDNIDKIGNAHRQYIWTYKSASCEF